MASRFLSLLLLPLVFQSPLDRLLQRYQAAEAQARAGNVAAAETECASILAEGYRAVSRIYLAQKKHKEAIAAVEAATLYQPASEEALSDLAITYFDAGQFDKALPPLHRAVAVNPQSSSVHSLLGKTYFALRDYGKAAEELRAALEFGSNDFDTSFTLAIAYLQQSQFTEARRVFDWMLQHFGDRPELHVVIGRAFRVAGRLPEAIDEFKKAIALNSRLARVHDNLALAYLSNEGASRLVDAEREFKTELISNPDEFIANYYLGIVYIFQRKWDLAIAFLKNASRVEPENPDPYFQLGQAYQELEQHDQAIDALKKAIALNPQLAHNKFQVTTAHYRLAQSLLKVGQAEEGRKELRLASELKAEAFKMAQTLGTGPSTMGTSQLPELEDKLPATGPLGGTTTTSNVPDEKTMRELKSAEAHYAKLLAAVHSSIGLLRADRGDFPAAAEQFRLAANWNPEQEDVDYNLGLAYVRAESYNDAVQPLETEVKTHPQNIRARWLLGLSYFRISDYRRASELLTDVITSDSTNVDLYYALTSSLIRLGKIELAGQAIQQMARVTGNSPQLHVLLGQQYYSQGDNPRALEELRAAVALDGRTRQAHYYAGLVYLKMKKFDEGSREFEAELGLNSNDVEARYQLAHALLIRNELVRGIQTMREVVKAKPDFVDARYELGKALLEQADIQEAVINLEIAARLDPQNPLVHYELGRAYIAAGRREEGRRQNEIFNQLRKPVPSRKDH
ncbi:MAG: tetratricopeptide repeat protein [Pyrinomonadaceae bacterium]